MATLSELIRRRQKLRERIAQLSVELEGLDRVIFPRIEKMAAALEGPAASTTAEEPTKYWRYATSNRLFHTPEVGPGTRIEFGSDGGVLAINGMSTSSGYAVPDVVPGTAVATGHVGPDGLVRRISTRGERYNGRLTDAVFEVLQQVGHPMKAGAIQRHLLVEKGIPVPGKQPLNNLSAHMSNDARFVSTSDGWTIRAPSLLPEWQESPTHG